jgi:hypothetical protein
MEIDELLGLPAHPLIVHAALALVPAAAVLTVVAALWPTARRRIGWLGVVLAALAVFTVWMAQGSGEELEHQVEETHLVEEHTELGDQMLIPAIAMLVGAVLVTAVGRRDGGPARTEESPAGSFSMRGASALSALVAVVGLATSGFAVVQVFRVGHSGAKAVWDETGKEGQERDNSGSGGGGDEEDEDAVGLGGVLLATLATSLVRRRHDERAVPGARVPQR